jgi:hypothetical protein
VRGLLWRFSVFGVTDIPGGVFHIPGWCFAQVGKNNVLAVGHHQKRNERGQFSSQGLRCSCQEIPDMRYLVGRSGGQPPWDSFQVILVFLKFY